MKEERQKEKRQLNQWAVRSIAAYLLVMILWGMVTVAHFTLAFTETGNPVWMVLMGFAIALISLLSAPFAVMLRSLCKEEIKIKEIEDDLEEQDRWLQSLVFPSVFPSNTMLTEGEEYPKENTKMNDDDELAAETEETLADLAKIFCADKKGTNRPWYVTMPSQTGTFCADLLVPGNPDDPSVDRLVRDAIEDDDGDGIYALALHWPRNEGLPRYHEMHHTSPDELVSAFKTFMRMVAEIDARTEAQNAQ